MAILPDILSKETTNKSVICLYKKDDKWFAYEHSAYHFTQIFKMGKIVYADNLVCVTLSNSFYFLYSQAMKSVQIISVADTEVIIDCATAFAGFEQWKEEVRLFR